MNKTQAAAASRVDLPLSLHRDHFLRAGILKLLAIKDSDIRILTLEQSRDAVDSGLHAGGAFSATIPLVALFFMADSSGSISGRPDQSRAGHLYPQQGSRGCGNGIHLRGAGLLFRSGIAAPLAIPARAY